jgi:hypothetical protein
VGKPTSSEASPWPAGAAVELSSGPRIQFVPKSKVPLLWPLSYRLRRSTRASPPNFMVCRLIVLLTLEKS